VGNDFSQHFADMDADGDEVRAAAPEPARPLCPPPSLITRCALAFPPRSRRSPPLPSRFSLPRQGVTWAEFTAFCRAEHGRAAAAGQIEKVERAAAMGGGGALTNARRSAAARKRASIEDLRQEQDRDEKHRAAQTAVLTQVFELVDADLSGCISQEEMVYALKHTPEVLELAKQSDALRPLLQEGVFMATFQQMDTDDADGVTLEEFVEFCLMVAEVAELNGMETEFHGIDEGSGKVY
jgi:hypothetical protein